MQDRSRIAAQIVIVTGAGAGIGREIARGFAAEGAELFLIDKDADALIATTDACATLARGVTPWLADVTDEPTTHALFDRIDQMFGRLDVLVNNAAIICDTPTGETSSQTWRDVLGTNLIAPFVWSQRAADIMAKNGFGRIINLSSHAAQNGTPGRSAYAASKAGLEALTRTLAVELAGLGITVNAIAPGAIETERTQSGHSVERRRAWTQSIPAGRYGTTGEIAALVRMLCEEDCGYLTGQTITVDGGFGIAGLRPAQ